MPFIEFSDKGFEKAVKSCLNITTDKVTLEDLKAIEGIMVTTKAVSGFSIPWIGDSTAFNMVYPDFNFNIQESYNGRWFEDMKHFTHIKTFHLYVPIQCLSFLKGFSNLKELYIVESTNKDWAFVQSLTNLQYLCLINCHFTDLEPIRKLSVQQMQQYQQEREQSNKYYIYKGLMKLHLEDCGIKNISPLTECALIDEINLSNNRIQDISNLQKMSSLYYLTLRHNNISDITTLGELRGVYYLNIRHNHIDDISPLSKLKNANLGRLFLSHNNIEDFTPLKGMDFVVDDIDDAMAARGKIQAQPNDFELVNGEKSILGKWSQGALKHTGLDDTIIVFKENGTGYLHWYDEFHETVNTFYWTIENGRMSIVGINRFKFYEGTLELKTSSTLRISKATVKKNSRKGLDGKEVKAIEFDFTPVEDEDYYFVGALGLVSDGGFDTGFSEKIKRIIFEG